MSKADRATQIRIRGIDQLHCLLVTLRRRERRGNSSGITRCWLGGGHRFVGRATAAIAEAAPTFA
jgi:hypothetical protein